MHASASSAVPSQFVQWLASSRGELNGRFRKAQRRFAQLDGDTVLALCREILAPLAGDEPAAAELLSSCYDLILLHAGRGLLTADGAGQRPGIGLLLRETFPRLRRLLLERPRMLPGALSNAVENSGPRGAAFARGLSDLAELASTEELLDLGALLAWRLGDTRCRESGLEIARRVAARPLLLALGEGHLPDSAAPTIVAGLAADGWRLPAYWSDHTDRPVRVSVRPLAEWQPAACLGNFLGFDGQFRSPPRLLDDGGLGMRHRFWIQSGDETFRLDADAYGWTCRVDDTVRFPLAEISRLRLLTGNKPRLSADGTVTFQKETARLPALAGATSLRISDSLLAFTLPDSFRVRIFNGLARQP